MSVTALTRIRPDNRVSGRGAPSVVVTPAFSIVRRGSHRHERKSVQKAIELSQSVRIRGPLREHPDAVAVSPGPHHWRIFQEIATASGCRGPDTTDAYFAALAIEHGCEWWTAGADFARFSRLRWRNILERRPGRRDSQTARARATTRTSAAPARINVSAHSFNVAPMVITSSTTRKRRPATRAGSDTPKAPKTSARRAPGPERPSSRGSSRVFRVRNSRCRSSVGSNAGRGERSRRCANATRARSRAWLNPRWRSLRGCSGTGRTASIGEPAGPSASARDRVPHGASQPPGQVGSPSAFHPDDGGGERGTVFEPGARAREFKIQPRAPGTPSGSNSLLAAEQGRKALQEAATIATPDTILRWYRELVAANYDGTKNRGPGRPKKAAEIVRLLLEMATRNTTWGYTRLRDALSNVGYDIPRTTVQRILAEHGIEPAPQREREYSSATFIKAHLGAIAGMDFFTVEVLTVVGLVRYHVLFVIDIGAGSSRW